MMFKKLKENPVLVIGILFMVIFVTTSGKAFMQKMFPNYRQRLMPTSCRALLVKLNRRIPANWNARCDKNNLNVEVNYELPKIKEITLQKVQKISYRELANAYVFIAKNSPSDNLERTDTISVRFSNRYIRINSVSEGKFVVKLSTLGKDTLIKQHFHATVQVQEVSLEKISE